jgi:phosphoserine aminotransferase
VDKESGWWIEAIEKMNIEKATLLYDAIDSSSVFEGTAEKDSRSLMNICFVMKEEYKDKEDAFMEFAKQHVEWSELKVIVQLGVSGHQPTMHCQ